jgi:hypothetical protein
MACNVPHKFIVGETGTGKTRLLTQCLMPAWARIGRPTIVLDPRGRSWPATFVTKDPDEWLATLQRSWGCVGIWDECGQMCYEDPAVARRLAWSVTVGRNWYHEIYLVAQRTTMVPPALRSQCSSAFIFHQVAPDAEAIAKQYGDPVLLGASSLYPGHAFVRRSFKRTEKTVFFNDITIAS